MTTATVTKICCMCRKDISQVRRIKDPQGHYFCEPCHAAALAKYRPAPDSAPVAPPAPPAANAPPAKAAAAPKAAPKAAQQPVAPPKTVAAKVTPPVIAAAAEAMSMELELDVEPEAKAPPAAEGDIFELADDPAHPPKPAAPAAVPSDEKAACSGCKKIVPASEVKLIDDEFLCGACQAKRGKTLGYAQAEPDGKSAAVVANSLLMTALWIVGAIAGTYLLMLFVMLAFPPAVEVDTTATGGAAPVLGLLYKLIAAAILTFGTTMLTAALLVSMIIASAMLGGIEFGALGPTTAKGMGICGGILALEIAGAHAGDWGMIIFLFPRIIFLVSIMLLFRLDYFEAFILGIINRGLAFLAWIGMLAALTALAAAFAT